MPILRRYWFLFVFGIARIDWRGRIRADLRHTKMPKANGNGQSIVISREQLALIQSKLDYRYKVLTDLMFFTGTRVSECIAIRWVDVVDNIVVIRKCNTKGKEGTREIPLPPHLVRAISNLPNINSYLFAGRNGNGHLSRYSVDKKLRQVCSDLGIKGFSTHGFRRSFITNLARNNTHTKLIMKCSGHKQMSSVEKYIETTEEEKFAAIATLW